MLIMLILSSMAELLHKLQIAIELVPQLSEKCSISRYQLFFNSYLYSRKL